MSLKKIIKLADINPEGINKLYQHKEIEYIDISSVGSGFLEGTTRYELSDAPSRAKRIVRENDIIMSTVRPNRRSFLFLKNPKENWIASTGFAVLRAKKNVNPRFLYYAVTNQDFTDYLSNNAKGAAYPAVDKEIIGRGDVYCPEPTIQNKIAGVLSAYDDLIENNTKRIKILEDMAQAIYKEWFVNFKFPNYENTTFIDHPELGKIPEGWEEKELSQIANVTMGQSPKSEYYNEVGEGLPFHQGVTNFGDRFPYDKVYCSVTSRVAEAGDILFSVRAPVGRINLANKKIVIGRGLSAISSNSDKQVFLYYSLKNKFKEEDTMGSGAIFNAITKADLLAVRLLTPEESIIDKFEDFVLPIYLEIGNLVCKNDNLRKTRDLLLPRLISGELDVENVEVAV